MTWQVLTQIPFNVFECLPSGSNVPLVGPKKGSDSFPTAVLRMNSQGLKCLLDEKLL